MEYRDRARIDSCCNDIAPKIDMCLLWPELLRNKIFNEDDVNIPTWETKLDEEETVREILDTIKTRGPYAFANLLRSLRNTGHNDVANMLQGRESFDPIENFPNNNIRQLNIGPTISNEQDDGAEWYWERKFMNSQEPLVIKVKRATRFMDGPSESVIAKYRMRRKPHGYVLIISIKAYLGEPVRDAAEHDASNLKTLFEDMGFEVTIPDPSIELTGAEIKRIVKEFSKKDFSKVDSCFVIISAHGDEKHYNGIPETEIHGIDYGLTGSEPVLCSDIIALFTAENCKCLIEKPKVFIFQSCRGEAEQTSVRTAADGFGATVLNGVPLVRNYSDILIAYSTIPGHKAYRDKYNGSWYIQILCEVFMNYACDTHIVDLFSMIDNILKKLRTYENRGQTSTVKLKGLNRHLYLNPGIFE